MKQKINLMKHFQRSIMIDRRQHHLAHQNVCNFLASGVILTLKWKHKGNILTDNTI